LSSQSPEERTADLFLSYAGDDRELIARPLVRAIRRAGLSVWYDEIDSPLRKDQEHPTRTVAKMLHNAILGSNQAWLLIGPSYRGRKWTQYEALSFAALSACGIADLGVFYHGIDDREVRTVLNELRLNVDCESARVMRYENNPQDIAARLSGFVKPRVNLMMMKHRGPIDIAVFEQLGQVFMFANGGLSSKNCEITAYDLCGHRIGKDTNMDGLLGTFLEESLDVGRSLHLGDASALTTIQSAGSVTLGFLNHPNQALYTTREIELGVVQSLGELFLIPAVTWGPVTVGEITDDPPQVVRDCLKTVEQAGIAEWSRIYFGDDGTFRVA
jgi:hypothetical protein